MGPATTASFGPIGVGGPALSSSANFDDEEPLLDELGIHPDQIWRKTKSILNPFRVNPAFYKDSDLSGPIFLYLSLCLFQLLAGKIQFGVILGWIVVSSIFLYVVFNMLAGRNGNLDLHTCTSMLLFGSFVSRLGRCRRVEGRGGERVEEKGLLAAARLCAQEKEAMVVLRAVVAVGG
ncbi:hypothetical protein Tsubulata_006990 [Turnera subulata]|uniref:Uncharacterized protein n=1 Tax=Turnera subulata TaxID=218843 RepID=A0A9Q0IZH4_9ROSI|nr:hypothetical protein Tsubulata_006990 [Turnera subulata]